MPLTASTRLGPYEIVAPLGAGGMGEVYRARDTRLGRDVAIKVLPQHLSTNPEVRARFEREAKTISSLNHPNICTLFDVGRDGDVAYLVMELIEGETLAARLLKGALAPGEVLKLGVQIADALDRAHRAGVVHRDLKPGNVMLTRSGAKLMDFGLARAIGLTGPNGGSGLTHAALTQSPTVAAPLTAEGTLVGTFQYMSPEQLEGKEADERSDLWALGCVLHEMATGRRAFEGRSQASLITAIMGSEPTPVSQITPLAPAGLDRLVRTCLTKDPEERARSAHDVKLQLLGIEEASSHGGVATPAIARPRKDGRLAWMVAAVATLAAIAMGAILVTRGREPRTPLHLTVEPPARTELTPYTSAIVLSPDGQYVAFCAQDSSGNYELSARRLDSPNATRLMSVPSVTIPFWSPDSRALGVCGNMTQLKTIPVEGGTPTDVAATTGARGATWSPRGVIVFAPNPQTGLFQVAVNGGVPTQVTWPDTARGESGHRFPFFLPDGEHFLYTSLPGGPDGLDICVGKLGSREVKKLLSANSAAVYARPGYLLFRRGSKITAQRFDARSLKLIGEPVPILDAAPLFDLGAEPVASASNDGRLVALENPPADTRLEWMGPDGTLRGPLALPAGPWGRPVLSPDDRFAVISNGDDLWRIDLARSIPIRLTSGEDVYSDPVWSPDGSKIAFTGGRGKEEIYVMPSDGSGEPKLLPTTDDLFKFVADWSPQGLLVTPIRSGSGRDVVLAPYPNGGAIPLAAGRASQSHGKVSPDGHWLAYLSTEAGSPADVYVQSFPTPGHKTRITSGGAEMMWWLPGNVLCYRTASRTHMMMVPLTHKGDDLEVGTPRVLFRYPPNVEFSPPTHDGQRLLVTISDDAARNRKARLVLNWTSMLKP